MSSNTDRTFGDDPATPVVFDTAENLLGAPAAAFFGVGRVTLIGNPTLSFRQLARLEMLPGFKVDPSAHVRLADTLSNTVSNLAEHPARFDIIRTLDVQLEGRHVGPGMASAFAALERRGVAVAFTASAQDGRPKFSAAHTSGGADRAPGVAVPGKFADPAATFSSGSPVVRTRIARLEALAELQIAPAGITVCDSAAAISADLALRGSSAILALLPQVRSIDVMDGGTIYLTAAQALTGGVDDGLDCALTLTNGGRLAITEARAAQFSQLRRLQVKPERIEITDSADAVIACLDQLSEAGSGLRVCLTDIWLQAAQVAQLARLGSALASGVPVRDGASQIAALVDAGDAAAIAYMNVHGAVLCADGIVAASDIAALSTLGGFDKAGYRLIVWDSAARLTAPGAAAILAGPLIDAIFLRTVDGAAVLSAGCAAELFALPGFSAANPDGSANYVTVRDSAARILACHAQIAAAGNGVSRIIVAEDGSVGTVALARLQALDATIAAGTTLAVCDTASLLAGAADAGGNALATILTLSGPGTVDAAAAETLLSTPAFVPGHTLTIADSAANLRRPTLIALIQSLLPGANISVRLVAPETLDKPTAVLLAALPKFTDPDGYVTISSHVNGAPADGRPIVTLGGPNTGYAAASIVRHSNSFLAASGSIHRAGELPVTQAIALKAVADLSADISRGAADIAIASEALAGAPSSLASPHQRSMTNDHHVVGVGPSIEPETQATRREAAAGGTTGGTVNVYGETGSLLSATVEQPGGFTVTAPDTGRGQAFSVTESVDGRESAPVVVLDAGTLENAVAAAHAEFASSGAIEVESGKYLDLYTAGEVPVLDRPALVYDPSAHTIALDIPGQAPLPLIVLGSSSNPKSLDVSEIMVKQAS
jgi:hypothetical protein